MTESLSGYACIADSKEQNIMAVSKGAQKTGISYVIENLVDNNGTKQYIAANAYTELGRVCQQVYQVVNESADLGLGIRLLGIDFLRFIMKQYKQLLLMLILAL